MTSMVATRHRGGTRSVPVPSPWSRGFWEAAARGELALQRCAGCDDLVYPPFPECPGCGSTALHYEVLSGRGIVHAATVVRSPILPGLEDELPVVCALVELVEQRDLLVVTNLVETPEELAATGAEVEVVFDRSQPHPLPMFRLCRAHY